jgi:hypothetical protein
MSSARIHQSAGDPAPLDSSYTQRRPGSTWSLVCVLICLFVLSVTAPTLWDRIVQDRPARDVAVDLARIDSAKTDSGKIDSGKIDSGKTGPRAVASVAAPVEGAASSQVAPRRIDIPAPPPAPRDPTPAPSAPSAPVASAAIQPSQRSTAEPERDDRNTEALTPALSQGERGPGLSLSQGETRLEQGDSQGATEPRQSNATAETTPSTPIAMPGETEPSPMVSSVSRPMTATVATPVSIPVPQTIDDGSDAPKPLPDSAIASIAPSAIPSAAPSALPSSPAETQPAQEFPVAEEPKPLLFWTTPQSLVEQLDELAVDCQTGQWAMEAERTLRQFGRAMDEDQSAAAQRLLARLAAFRQEGDAMADRVADASLAVKLRRAAYALDRRLAVWQPTLAAGGLRAPAGDGVRGDTARLSACLDAVDTLTRGSAQGRAWGEYLTLDSLRTLADGRSKSDDDRRAAATAALERLARVPMNPRQRQFLSEKPMASLRDELERWAVRPGQLRDVLGHVEQFEQSTAAADGRLLAEDCRRLAMSSSPVERKLAESLEGYYRNANLRVAVDVRLLNQLIPARPDEREFVNTVVGGQSVNGQAVTSSQAALRLVPDPNRVRMVLEIQGAVSALTRSVSGPATFYDDSEAAYLATKAIELGSRGLIVHPAEVAVNQDIQLRGVSTDFDPIPVISQIAQEVARAGHDSKRCEMNAAAEQRVWARAKEKVDAEADARLGQVARRIQDAVIEPLAALALGPAVIAGETTKDRVSMRLRLASDEQLGGNTPRPRAPADCLASVQVHQSALNNVLDQLDLDGATLTLPQLRQRIAQRFHLPDMLRQQTDVEEVKITFAAKTAAQVQCRDGQVALTLSIARFELDSRSWDDFQVRVVYRPQAAGRSAELVRDELIELEGENLNTRSQIALRGVLAKAFSRQRSLPLVPERIVNDPRLARLRVAQVVIEDGWLAMAWDGKG